MGLSSQDGKYYFIAYGIFCLVGVTVNVLRLISHNVLRLIRQSTWKRVSDRTCGLCGYEWRLAQGDPELPVRVDPNLIYLGAKKLEEDARRWDD